MKVLIACEESQVVCKAFRERGHEAYSCDLLPTSGNYPEWHIQDDVLNHLDNGWDLVIVFPPCTRLCNSGVRWLAERDLWDEMNEGIKFFLHFQNFGNMGYKVAIENPIPHKYAKRIIGSYTQIIQPWQFGHPETKATCLWLYNLPKLIPDKIVSGRNGKIWKMPPSPERSKLRSRTFPGIAKAMADQWSEDLGFLNTYTYLK